MSASSEQWSPGSTKALGQDLGWLALCIVLFGACALWEPFSIDISPTALELIASVVLGTTLGIIMVAFSLTDVARRIWEDKRSQFIFIFTLGIGMQLVLQAIPMWTVLTMLAAFVAAVPTRLYLYRRARQA